MFIMRLTNESSENFSYRVCTIHKRDIVYEESNYEYKKKKTKQHKITPTNYNK